MFERRRLTAVRMADNRAQKSRTGALGTDGRRGHGVVALVEPDERGRVRLDAREAGAAAEAPAAGQVAGLRGASLG